MNADQQSHLIGAIYQVTDAPGEKIEVITTEDRPRLVVKYHTQEARDLISRLIMQKRFEPARPFAVTFVQLNALSSNGESAQ